MTLYEILEGASKKSIEDQSRWEKIALAARWLGQEEGRGSLERTIQESSNQCIHQLPKSRYHHLQKAAVAAGIGKGHSSLNTDAKEIGSWEFDG